MTQNITSRWLVLFDGYLLRFITYNISLYNQHQNQPCHKKSKNLLNIISKWYLSKSSRLFVCFIMFCLCDLSRTFLPNQHWHTHAHARAFAMAAAVNFDQWPMKIKYLAKNPNNDQSKFEEKKLRSSDNSIGIYKIKSMNFLAL